MKYRGFEYTIIQGYERGTWRWSVSLKDGRIKAGNVLGKSEALGKIERAIDKAIALVKAQLDKEETRSTILPRS